MKLSFLVLALLLTTSCSKKEINMPEGSGREGSAASSTTASGAGSETGNTMPAGSGASGSSMGSGTGGDTGNGTP